MGITVLYDPCSRLYLVGKGKMAMQLQILKGLLQGHLIRMLDEGVVNDQFNALVCPRNNGDRARDHVVQLIETYLADVDVILSDLSLHVDNPLVDFDMLACLSREIEDKSTSIGAEHMKLACFDVIQACDEWHIRRFSQSLTCLINEFEYTSRKFRDFVKMEKRIIRLESSQAPPS